jgi:phosphoribosylformylglycinamidine cyclo-ligase
MPGVYAPNGFDLAGFCVGVVARSSILGPQRVAVGDVLLGLPSNGLHSNGYSLVRAVLGEKATESADELLRPTRLYPKAVRWLIGLGGVHAIAHITGGGLPGNVSRILPDGLKAVIHTDRWSVPDVFSLIAQRGRIERDEMMRTFNMGVGLVLAVDPQKAEGMLAQATADSPAAGLFAMGNVVEGKRDVELR